MGVSGSGKTTIGAMLAGRFGWRYGEADDFHPLANVEKMHAGIPLTDEDRWPWLRALGAWMGEQADPTVVTCSALKRKYRELLREDRPDLRLIYLDGSKELISARLAARHGHFFPKQLLESQFADLEPPQEDEDALVVSIDQPLEKIVQEIYERLGLPADAAPSPGETESGRGRS
jgi:gluconokinase